MSREELEKFAHHTMAGPLCTILGLVNLEEQEHGPTFYTTLIRERTEYALNLLKKYIEQLIKESNMNLLYASLALPRYGEDFLKKVVVICEELGIRPDWLMCVMKNESAINHLAVNTNGGATGLIQFMPATAKGLGTSCQELKEMGALAQLDYVKKYFWPYRHKIKTATDLYIITFYPYALTQPDSYVIGSQKGAAYVRLVALQNKGFDMNKDQQITLGEFRQSVRNKTFQDLSDAQMFK